ncbi:MAG: DsbA family oxidoreductase [Tissierellia bacterium]|nr:DsbA family oxidoreductase [Tissierellia bacterium]
MKIDIWSDFVCPFCYIGEQGLRSAIEDLSLKGKVEITFKSFELDPNYPGYTGDTIHEVLAKKYGMPLEEAKLSNEQVAIRAKEMGLNYDYDNMKYTNTLDAHRLMKHAKKYGKDLDLAAGLFSGYFEEGRLISDKDSLLEIAAKAGLDKEESKKVLDDKEAYLKDVRNDENTARQIGISSVPFFVVNDKYSISGGQPKDVFVNALSKIIEEESIMNNLQDLTSGSCSDCAACGNGTCSF